MDNTEIKHTCARNDRTEMPRNHCRPPKSDPDLLTH